MKKIIILFLISFSNYVCAEKINLICTSVYKSGQHSTYPIEIIPGDKKIKGKVIANGNDLDKPNERSNQSLKSLTVNSATINYKVYINDFQKPKELIIDDVTITRNNLLSKSTFTLYEDSSNLNNGKILNILTAQCELKK
jgi:hypothetical protein